VTTIINRKSYPWISRVEPGAVVLPMWRILSHAETVVLVDDRFGKVCLGLFPLVATHPDADAKVRALLTLQPARHPGGFIDAGLGIRIGPCKITEATR
jgi:hypothetical protein